MRQRGEWQDERLIHDHQRGTVGERQVIRGPAPFSPVYPHTHSGAVLRPQVAGVVERL